MALAEEILGDHHSTAMLFKVLLALYPHRLDLFTAAVEEAVAVGELDEEVNRGAVFVNVLKELAADAGVELGLRGEGAETGDWSPVVSPSVTPFDPTQDELSLFSTPQAVVGHDEISHNMLCRTFERKMSYAHILWQAHHRPQYVV